MLFAVCLLLFVFSDAVTQKVHMYFLSDAGTLAFAFGLWALAFGFCFFWSFSFCFDTLQSEAVTQKVHMYFLSDRHSKSTS